MRSLVCAAVEREGLVCAPAPTRASALAALAEFGSGVRLALVDAHLEDGAGGLELAAAIHALLPAVPIAVMCAEAGPLEEAGRMPGVVLTVRKPGGLRQVRELARMAVGE